MLIGPSYCTCGANMVCGGPRLGCNPCSAAIQAGRSCGNVCAATPRRLALRSCWLCSGPINGLYTPGGYCSACVFMVSTAQQISLN